MTVHDEHRHHGPQPTRRPRVTHPRGHLVHTIVLGIALVAMLFLHRDALLSGNVLAIVLVAACLLLHPLMHRGHGAHAGASERRDD